MKLMRLPRQSGEGPPQSKTLARFGATFGIRGAFWSAPAERSGDGAFGLSARFSCQPTPQSGVALRLPPQSRIAGQVSEDGLGDFLSELPRAYLAERRGIHQVEVAADQFGERVFGVLPDIFCEQLQVGVAHLHRYI